MDYGVGWTEPARTVLDLAREEAQRFNHNYIGTEHLLLGLVREREGVAARVLSNLGVEHTKVRNAVEFIIGRGDRTVVGEIGLTPRAKKVIELAVDESRRFGHDHVGTEHLLLGMIREGEGIASGVLESLGVNLQRVRKETLAVIDGKPSAEPRAEAAARGAAERGPEAVAWEYRAVPVEWREGVPIFVLFQDRGEQGSPRDLQAPLRSLLSRLGEQGWELSGIDTSAPESSLYLFKRPKR